MSLSYLCFKLSSKHVNGPPAGQGGPLLLQPVFKAEWGHHVHGVHLEGRLFGSFS